ncbi:CDP-glycerol glycerophosphotransferase family protein [Streptococcus suis]
MEFFSDCCNIGIRVFIRLIFRFFYLFPIKSNRILFKSFLGKSYSCNPKYIAEYINDNFKGEYELLFVLNNPGNETVPSGIRCIRNNSLQYFFYRFTSKVIISNMTYEVYLPKRKKQIFIQTWHAGGAYKKVGNSYYSKQSLATSWQNGIVENATDYYLSSSELFTKYNIREAYRYTGVVLPFGMPRNDLFFQPQKLDLIRKKIVSQLNLKDAYIVLYAPTFRGDYADNIPLDFSLPIDNVIKILEDKVGCKVFVLNRAHYNSKSRLYVSRKYQNQVLDVTDYPDMQELLVASDMLITDYSSSMWDFSLLKRPCILYVPDLVSYDSDRGMYTPIEEWPGFITRNVEELEEVLWLLDYKVVTAKANKHQEKFGSYESGEATEKIVNIMIEEIEKR